MLRCDSRAIVSHQLVAMDSFHDNKTCSRSSLKCRLQGRNLISRSKPLLKLQGSFSLRHNQFKDRPDNRAPQADRFKDRPGKTECRGAKESKESKDHQGDQSKDRRGEMELQVKTDCRARMASPDSKDRPEKTPK